jgi:hypothetical protein
VVGQVVILLQDLAANVTARKDADGGDEEEMTWPNNPLR